ncbi:hypothetical protein FisN_11Lh122 [Fistulifera solaris]|uniref:F-box domain-containing protein n=1 Tax=Fistulifera solaris TaxID=1519565 RepID=A0A1Z5J7D0_FISSO|nr:hypothetical protein FisN_11Lh122 [Fistulifera solaris]|eukprot:GAX09893.1 hypothetical protein FisN_11Lh122 [Fistulifera solaris]
MNKAVQVGGFPEMDETRKRINRTARDEQLGGTESTDTNDKKYDSQERLLDIFNGGDSLFSCTKRSAADGVSSFEEGGDSSSGGSIKDGDPAVITSANTTSSSDDVKKQSTRQWAGASNSSHNNSSSSDDVRENQSRGGMHECLTTTTHNHHHFSRQNKPSGESSDVIGLPALRDDRVSTKSSTEHSSVVAHLPPPYSESSGSGGDSDGRTKLVQPHHEPGYHTIKRTLNQWATGSAVRNTHHRKAKQSTKRPSSQAELKDTITSRKRTFRYIQERAEKDAEKEDGDSNDDAGGSSGSGTEGGYAGSASSNDRIQPESSSSPSVSSSESHLAQRYAKSQKTVSGDPKRPMLRQKQESSFSVSSDIADFSSAGESCSNGFRQSSSSPSDSPSITSSSNGDGSSDDQDDGHLKKARNQVHDQSGLSTMKWPLMQSQHSSTASKKSALKEKTVSLALSLQDGKKTGIMSLGCDLMVHVLTFLEPPEILDVLIAPLSKDWLTSFTRQPELWRVLCLLEPFKAQVQEDFDDSGYESTDSFPIDVTVELKRTFGKFRLMYTSFIKCMRYLQRIKEDTANGRTPPIDSFTSANSKSGTVRDDKGLREFLSKARKIKKELIPKDSVQAKKMTEVREGSTLPVASKGTELSKKRPMASKESKSKKPKYGYSMITERLLGPTATGDPGNVNLPWSCALYSIVNWMTAFSDIEGIQTMCLKVLPPIMENEHQRSAAQRAGLTNNVLRAMVRFPDSAPLHTAAFHAIVLLARPLGGREGMLFHSSMVNASSIFDSRTPTDQGGKSGIAVMLDSIKRFEYDGVLQAMSCWSLVNIALAPAQKQMLVKLGGIQATANAMMIHPYDAEVQVGICHCLNASYF